jgi:beta-galactosidase
MLTRRQLLQTGPAALAGAALALRNAGATPPGPAVARRLTEGWEHYRGSLSGIWEVWRGKAAAANVTWDKVTLPHCFNAWDAVDPDRPYYQGPGWYRTTLQVENPYPNGRTLLHFEGAGQTSEVFAGLKSVGRHIGGYDEFTFDITGASGNTKVAVECDNSRSTDTIPSDQSDFNRYGGIYRHVNLVYVPAVSLERALISTKVADGGVAVSVQARLLNPANARDSLKIETRVTDASGREVHASSQSLAPWRGARQVAAFTVASPALWSPKTPHLYRCSMKLAGPQGEHAIEERFGIRSFKFPPHGVFHLNGEKLFLRGTQRHEDHAGWATP